MNHSFKIVFSVLLLIFSYFPQLVYAEITTNLVIATWNLEHHMSKADFIKWNSFCSSHSWVDPENRNEAFPEYKNLPYCNALNGLEYPTDKSESLPIHTRAAQQQKTSKIKNTIKMLGADIYALQEFTNRQALLEIFDPNIFKIFTSENQNISQNIGFAIRKKIIGKNTPPKINVIDSLSIFSDDGHQLRPGLQLDINLSGFDLRILNVHLKSGCSTRSITAPTKKTDTKDKIKKFTKACKLFAKQIQILEKWIEGQQNKNVILLGDFNRQPKYDRDLRPVRRDGEAPSEPHTKTTQYSGFYSEIADGVPLNADTLLVRQVDASGPSKCMFGFDQILANRTFLNQIESNIDWLRAVKMPFSSGKHPIIGVVKPSDHCPVRIILKLIPKPEKIKHDRINANHVLDLKDYNKVPFSNLLVGASKSSPNLQIREKDCNLVQRSSSLVCLLLKEQSTKFSLNPNIVEYQKTLYGSFSEKVIWMVNPQLLREFHKAITKEIEQLSQEASLKLSTELLQKEKFIISYNSKDFGKYLRPYIFQANEGIGVNVIFDKNNYVYNVGYIFKKHGPGRSYNVSLIRNADDVSYKDYFERLDNFITNATDTEQSQFYTALFNIIISSNADEYSKLAPKTQSLLGDFLAIYIAEATRHYSNVDTTDKFHLDLLTVTMLAPWSLKSGLVITDEGVIPHGEARLTNFIGTNNDNSNFGLGFFRKNRKTAQENICNVLLKSNLVSKKGADMLSILDANNKNNDCIYQLANSIELITLKTNRYNEYPELLSEFVQNIRDNECQYKFKGSKNCIK